MQNYKFLAVLVTICLSSCTNNQADVPTYRTSYVAGPSQDLNSPPFPGYAFYGSWHAGTPSYIDTTIAVDND